MGKLTKEQKAHWEKSVRLNHGNRDNFIKTVVAHIMPDEKRPTTENFATKWQSTLYDVIYTPEVLKAMAACPAWMFLETEYYYVNMDPKKRPDRYGTNVQKFRCPRKGLRTTERETGDYGSHDSDVGCPTIDPEHASAKEWAQIETQSMDWQAKKSSLESQLKTIAYDCNTSHQLYELWPEALNFAQECFPYTAPGEIQRGGESSVSASELNIGIMMAKTSVGAVQEN